MELLSTLLVSYSCDHLDESCVMNLAKRLQMLSKDVIWLTKSLKTSRNELSIINYRTLHQNLKKTISLGLFTSFAKHYTHCCRDETNRKRGNKISVSRFRQQCQQKLIRVFYSILSRGAESSSCAPARAGKFSKSVITETFRRICTMENS